MQSFQRDLDVLSAGAFQCGPGRPLVVPPGQHDPHEAVGLAHLAEDRLADPAPGGAVERPAPAAARPGPPRGQVLRQDGQDAAAPALAVDDDDAAAVAPLAAGPDGVEQPVAARDRKAAARARRSRAQSRRRSGRRASSRHHR